MSGLHVPRLVGFGGERPNPPAAPCPLVMTIGNAPRVAGETVSVPWPAMYRPSDVEWWARWAAYTGASRAAFTVAAHDQLIRTINAKLAGY